MFERPTKAGLWHREGKNYRVWKRDDGSFGAEHIDANGMIGAYYGNDLPTGNWQPLVVPVTREEAKKELHEWISLNMLGSGYDRLVNKAAEIFAGVPQEPDQIAGLKARLIKQFSCPQCGGCHFGTQNALTDLKDRVLECHDQCGIGCKWKGPYNDGIVDRDTALARMEAALSRQSNALYNLQREAKDLKATIARLEGEVENLKTRIVGIQAEQFVTNAEARELQDVLRTLTPSGTALKTSACELVKMLQELKEKATSAPPEVIEGSGQAVTRDWLLSNGFSYNDATGVYIHEDLWQLHVSESSRGHWIVSISSCLLTRDFRTTDELLGLIAALTGPPRPTFTPPPKPDMLIRHKALADPCWAYRDGTGFRTGAGNWWDSSEVELLDEQTGEPVKE